MTRRPADTDQAAHDTAAAALPALRTYEVAVLGCKVNQYEAQQIATLLERGGLTRATGDAVPDLVVLHTCAVTAEALRQSAQRARRLQRRHPRARLVVTGCGGAPGLLDAAPAAAVVPPGPDWVAELAAVLDTLPLPHPLDEEARAADGPAIERFDGHARAYLKIQDGCDLDCSYCIVPSLRQAPRDKPLPALLAEARALADRGYRELVVTGVCVGLYGRRGGVPSLAHALRELAALPGIERLRLSSLHPAELTDELLAVWADTPQLAPHAHLPLQSGSDAVLRRMRRGYTAKSFLRAVDRLRGVLDRPAVNTDLIAGFPGETDTDFARTEHVCRETGFSRVHVFPYSVRPGTPAAELPGAVDPATARHRAKRLRALGTELAAAFHAGFTGETVEVLVERIGDDGQAAGYSGRYIPVRFPAEGAAPGELARVRIESTDAAGARGCRIR